MFFNQYPYLNLNDFNLDYILKALKSLSEELENFISLNTIKYANPIQWNITKQYEANTVVIDANDGTAYLSVKPVPTGVAITNTDYWSPIFTLNLLSANQNITLRDDGSNVLATFASSVDDWLIWNSTLYKVSRAIAVNEAYVVGYNLTRYSVEKFIREYIDKLKNTIGVLSDLTTSDTDSIVDAINSIITERGDLADLTTSDTDSIVDAINEVTKKPIATPEIYGAVGDGVTDDSAALQAAVSSNAIVYLKDNATYYIANTVNVPKGHKIIGAGALLVEDGVNGLVLNGNNEIEGITFNDNGSTYQNSTAIIYALQSDNLSIHDCKFTDIHHGYCIHIEYSNYIDIFNNYVNGYAYAAIMLSSTCTHIKVNQNKVLNGYWIGNNNRYPICVSGYTDSSTNHGPAEYIQCNYNYIEDTAPLWEGIDSHGCYNAEFIGNTIKNTVYGIALGEPTSAGNLPKSNENIIISNNNINCYMPSTISASYVGYCIGISAKNKVSNVIIESNTCKHTGDSVTSASVGSSCIFIASSADDKLVNVKIKNNLLYTPVNAISFSHVVNTAETESIEVAYNNIINDTAFTISNAFVINFNEVRGYYRNVDIHHNYLNVTATYSYRGWSASLSGELIKYHDNIDNSTYDQIVYSTCPRSAIAAATVAAGNKGDFIPCNNTSGTVAGWQCLGAGHWLALAGSVV